MTLGMAKKKDPEMFNKGMIGGRELREAGGALAMRALGWGTLYAFTGFSIFCFGVWKLIGVKDVSVSLCVFFPSALTSWNIYTVASYQSVYFSMLRTLKISVLDRKFLLHND